MALTSKHRTAAVNGTGQAGSPSRPLPVTDTAPRRQRRPAVIGLGLALAGLGALGAVTLVEQAGDRIDVIAVARPVAVGERIEAADLAVARINADTALAPVPVSRQKEVLGRRAATDLSPGALLTKEAVATGRSYTMGKHVVGILAKPGQLPAQALRPGDRVALVHTPEETGQSQVKAPDVIEGVVSRVGEPDANGARVVDVALPGTDSPVVAAWAAVGRVAVVWQAGD